MPMFCSTVIVSAASPASTVMASTPLAMHVSSVGALPRAHTPVGARIDREAGGRVDRETARGVGVHEVGRPDAGDRGDGDRPVGDDHPVGDAQRQRTARVARTARPSRRVDHVPIVDRARRNVKSSCREMSSWPGVGAGHWIARFLWRGGTADWHAINPLRSFLAPGLTACGPPCKGLDPAPPTLRPSPRRRAGAVGCAAAPFADRFAGTGGKTFRAIARRGLNRWPHAPAARGACSCAAYGGIDYCSPRTPVSDWVRTPSGARETPPRHQPRSPGQPLFTPGPRIRAPGESPTTRKGGPEGTALSND